jgi:hypothetical protein
MGPNAKRIAKGWEYLARGSWVALAADYREDMKFIMPGQDSAGHADQRPVPHAGREDL